MKDANEGDQRMMSGRIGAKNDTANTSSSRNLRQFNYLKDLDTASFLVINSNRRTVTIMGLINLKFGSKVISSMGIVLNNMMDDFLTRLVTFASREYRMDIDPLLARGLSGCIQSYATGVYTINLFFWRETF